MFKIFKCEIHGHPPFKPVMARSVTHAQSVFLADAGKKPDTANIKEMTQVTADQVNLMRECLGMSETNWRITKNNMAARDDVADVADQLVSLDLMRRSRDGFFVTSSGLTVLDAIRPLRCERVG